MSIMAADVVGYQPSELSRSEEEESLLKKIREEKEQLWYDIQVCQNYVSINNILICDVTRIYDDRSLILIMI